MMTAHSASAPLIYGITGASGTRLAFHLLKQLLIAGQSLYVVTSDKALLVASDELGLKLGAIRLEERPQALVEWLHLPASCVEQLRWFSDKDVGAAPASGTHLCRGMIVAPCSMGTLAKIAAGFADTLLTRSADVCLKERRPLVLLPRETPLNAIHLENMLKLSRLGVHLLPPMLAFYQSAFDSVDGQLDYISGKVLDYFDLPHTLYPRWAGIGQREEVKSPMK
jgi:flavin prenyltransferase